MSKFKVIEVETKAFGDGKEMKKLTLKQEGFDTLEPRVTMWSNHNDYSKAEVGDTVTGVLEKKDSGTPIPEHPGKNYVNRTLLPEGSVSSPTPSNSLEAKVDEILSILKKKGDESIPF